MLALQLHCSTRLRDFQAIKYYTHVLPTQSTMYKAMEETYQGYLCTVPQNKNHKLGPPMIHRGKALFDHVGAGEEALKEKEELKAMRPAVKEVVVAELAFANPYIETERAANIFGHCKTYEMHDQSMARLVFVMPEIVTCAGRTTTLGSVVSRLLRSMGITCTGVQTLRRESDMYKCETPCAALGSCCAGALMGERQSCAGAQSA